MVQQSVDYIPLVNSIPDSKFSLANCIPTEDDIQEMISKVDVDKVTKLITYYNGGKFPNPESIDKIMRQWAISKFPYYVLLRRTLFIEKQIKFRVRRTDFVDKMTILLTPKIIERKGKNGDVKFDSGVFKLYEPIIRLFTVDELSKNQSENKIFPKGLKINYKEGQKISRFFSSFFKDKNFDIEWSKLLQNKDREEKLRISIHPLDYLTASWNSNSWTSCYTPGGCHAEGLLEFMYDKATMVTYISHDEFNPIGDVYWNSKIIRNFVHMSLYNCAFAVARCYPNVDNEEYYKCVVDVLSQYISEYFKTDDQFILATITQSMTGESCHGEYTLSGPRNNKRVHVDKNKRCCYTSSSIAFCDPIKYLGCFENRVVPIEIGNAEAICTQCGEKRYELVSRRFYCKKCGERM